ncbi:phosphatase PAP2 family protein [Bradyrhizobium sp. CCBAU 51627]|uniref:phosphatase PAP2 family protein n=1 Tax=Bradyrhizobium sp. CCBAU 51627 TaxID=1325088 RepID=UPI00230523CA|nr:phosphatase PAP2 family protein [Bradyrhizobium sp. CCBAU 51627]MDA9434295.1 hypothetical protein [Bradyrhizobium sp. CCBAU 51627]
MSTLTVAIDGGSVEIAAITLLFLVTTNLVYDKWRPAPVLSNLCGAVAVLFVSIGMAGIISLVGLRHNATFIDDTLTRADQYLGFDTPSMIAWFADHPVCSEILKLAYASSFVQLFGLVVLLSLLRRFDKLWELVFVCSFTIVASTTFSVFWPAIGAFAHYDYAAGIHERLPMGAGLYHLSKLDYFRNAALPVVSFANLHGVVTFPSFHCCLALMTVFAATGTRWLFWTLVALNVPVLISTLPIGGHYVIDLPAGALLWLAAAAAAAMLNRPELPRASFGDFQSAPASGGRRVLQNEKPRREGRGLRSDPRTSGEPIVEAETSRESCTDDDGMRRQNVVRRNRIN